MLNGQSVLLSRGYETTRVVEEKRLESWKKYDNVPANYYQPPYSRDSPLCDTSFSIDRRDNEENDRLKDK